MGLIIEWVLDEAFSALARSIYRSLGWVGCAVAVIAPLTMLGLILWAILRLP